MKVVALDVGERHTGVALFDPAIDFVIPLDTIHHADEAELLDVAEALLRGRGATTVVVGLPLLLSGVEGSQAKFAKRIGAQLVARGFDVAYVDERFTTDRQTPSDGDAKAACIVLNTYLRQKQ
jgi:putative Holliday junction resolvase